MRRVRRRGVSMAMVLGATTTTTTTTTSTNYYYSYYYYYYYYYCSPDSYYHHHHVSITLKSRLDTRNHAGIVHPP